MAATYVRAFKNLEGTLLCCLALVVCMKGEFFLFSQWLITAVADIWKGSVGDINNWVQGKIKGASEHPEQYLYFHRYYNCGLYWAKLVIQSGISPTKLLYSGHFS